MLPYLEILHLELFLSRKLLPILVIIVTSTSFSYENYIFVMKWVFVLEFFSRCIFLFMTKKARTLRHWNPFSCLSSKPSPYANSISLIFLTPTHHKYVARQFSCYSIFSRAFLSFLHAVNRRQKCLDWKKKRCVECRALLPWLISL